MTDALEIRDTFYDYEVELPSGLWHLGYRTLKMRTSIVARGFEDEEGKFIVRQVVRTIGHEVNPEGWTEPPKHDDGRRRSKV
jgi:hypothetical protein